MQSGNKNSNKWFLEFFTNDTGINPLMGWESSTDTLGEIKLEFSDKNIEFSKLKKKIENYFENHYFIEELEKIKEIYSEDPLRVKHIRNSIVNSLQDEKMIFRIYDIAKDLK